VSTQQFLAACLACAAATASQAEPVYFACPKAGTVEERAVSTQQYTGTSPSDPYICTMLGRTGKPELRLFNLYTLSEINNTAEAMAPIRAGMLDLLSGRKTSASFPRTASNGYILQETWTVLRKEPYAVNGKTFDTIVFDQEIKSDPRGRSDFHGHYTMWLDPKAGLWLKSDLHVLSGSTNMYPQAYQDHAITIP
jgi:predicted RNA-binding Zn-ribbon protein involved in translation (DUF1610 family)